MTVSSTTDSNLIVYNIFDMDGLLIDSEPLWLKAQQTTLQELYGLNLSKQDLHPFQGVASRSFCQSMSKKYPSHSINEAILLDTLIIKMQACIEQAPLLPGAKELLKWLQRQSRPIAIASSSPLSLINKVIGKYDLTVDVIASGEEVSRSKPHPMIFELAAQRLGARPEQCRIWEDSIAGVIAAKAAGMQVVAIPAASHPHIQQFTIADFCFGSLHESQFLIEST